MTPLPWTTYFVADGAERVKIGRTRDLAARIQDLTTSTGLSLSLLGTIPADVERVWQQRWRACRIRGEWFTPALAQALRDTLGVRIQAARPRPSHMPPTVGDVAAALEARSGWGLRQTDLEACQEWLYDVLWADWSAHPDEIAGPDEGKDEERADERFDVAFGELRAAMEAWDPDHTRWLGWMASPAPLHDGWLDVWVVFWRPREETAAQQLRSAILHACIMSDETCLEPLRFRPVLVDPVSAGLEELLPEECYGDALQFAYLN
jgi:hypothetical protein